MKSIKINWKSIKKFIFAAFWFYITMEILEWLLNHFFHINLSYDKIHGFGWLIFLVIYGFKFHLFCCVGPFLYAAFRCRHKRCHHDHSTP